MGHELSMFLLHMPFMICVKKHDEGKIILVKLLNIDDNK